eukprot:TRINITY_DN5935_c0_g3_i1.p1 TRINITY_DN5935_c0_g3~~TRINITY_DN5935_c0_g3_i1.p1  ORF type:complete len:354 (-),score=15.93 TRINITY_DN5935_c0_g3_i1:138-1199(-)
MKVSTAQQWSLRFTDPFTTRDVPLTLLLIHRYPQTKATPYTDVGDLPHEVIQLICSFLPLNDDIIGDAEVGIRASGYTPQLNCCYEYCPAPSAPPAFETFHYACICPYLGGASEGFRIAFSFLTPICLGAPYFLDAPYDPSCFCYRYRQAHEQRCWSIASCAFGCHRRITETSFCQWCTLGTGTTPLKHGLCKNRPDAFGCASCAQLLCMVWCGGRIPRQRRELAIGCSPCFVPLWLCCCALDVLFQPLFYMCCFSCSIAWAYAAASLMIGILLLGVAFFVAGGFLLAIPLFFLLVPALFLLLALCWCFEKLPNGCQACTENYCDMLLENVLYCQCCRVFGPAARWIFEDYYR